MRFKISKHLRTADWEESTTKKEYIRYFGNVEVNSDSEITMGVGIEKYLVRYTTKFGFGIVSVITEENTDSEKLVIEGANNSKTSTDITKETGTSKAGKEEWKQLQFIKQGKDCRILPRLDMFLAGYMVLENGESYQFVVE